mmetsp:Transcript_36110/g.76025  ORF Transcript_36110/g.76025 Transcript_36110/m.76025 type:complete len:229 (+) Transcript_36110:1387-2073(+)
MMPGVPLRAGVEHGGVGRREGPGGVAGGGGGAGSEGREAPRTGARSSGGWWLLLLMLLLVLVLLMLLLLRVQPFRLPLLRIGLLPFQLLQSEQHRRVRDGGVGSGVVCRIGVGTRTGGPGRRDVAPPAEERVPRFRHAQRQRSLGIAVPQHRRGGRRTRTRGLLQRGVVVVVVIGGGGGGEGIAGGGAVAPALVLRIVGGRLYRVGGCRAGGRWSPRGKLRLRLLLLL